MVVGWGDGGVFNKSYEPNLHLILNVRILHVLYGGGCISRNSRESIYCFAHLFSDMNLRFCEMYSVSL